ncbi:MAG: GNAT family N-acetyltransferase [Erythrobacter sp.]|nr:GNAT family N-acetyltransferase [Erythrobacter sp.]
MSDETILRPPDPGELAAASALCLRSKAHWGYDEAFMAACREALTLTATDLANTDVVLAVHRSELAGIAQVSFDEDGSELDKLFVEPERIGHGLGRKLFDWAIATAVRKGARSMLVTADPFAVPFYEKVGFKRIGMEPSGSIPGRELPVYRMDL